MRPGFESPEYSFASKQNYEERPASFLSDGEKRLVGEIPGGNPTIHTPFPGSRNNLFVEFIERKEKDMFGDRSLLIEIPGESITITCWFRWLAQLVTRDRKVVTTP